MFAYLIDDDSLVLASLRAALVGRYEVQTFQSAQSFLSDLSHLPPGVALLDLAMPEMTGGQLHEELLSRDAPIAVVFLTGTGGVPEAVEAMRRGAVDFLNKPISRTGLLEAMQRAGQRLTGLLEDRLVRSVVSTLTERELQVLEGLAKGLSSKVLAHQLAISVRTVEMHRARLCDKLGVPTTAAVAIASRAGLFRSGDNEGIGNLHTSDRLASQPI